MHSQGTGCHDLEESEQREGQVEQEREDDDEGVKELGAPPRGRWATWGNVFTTAGLVAALGGLLISGTLVRWVASLWQMLYM